MPFDVIIVDFTYTYNEYISKRSVNEIGHPSYCIVDTKHGRLP